VIDLASRRVQIVGSTPHPHDGFMQQVVRTMTAADDGLLAQHRLLICDRDTKWSAPVRGRLSEAGIRVVQTPYQAPNANAYAERFVRSIKEECLNRVIPFGGRHLRRTIAEYVRALPSGAESPRSRQRVDRTCLGGRASRSDSSASAPRRLTQLLRSRGVSVGSTEHWDNTSIDSAQVLVLRHRPHEPWR
jgi:Integrase core domain